MPGYTRGKITITVGGIFFPGKGSFGFDEAGFAPAISEKFFFVTVGNRIVQTLTHSEYIAMIYNHLEPHGA